MCDTVCAVTESGVVFGKNSDREPGEAQVVEPVPARGGLPGAVRCTHVEVPQVERTRALVLSRPAWMWGCEMGLNDAGVVAGNEAVFTRVPVERTGLTGMDVMRLALERAGSAREAVDVTCGLVEKHPQGGRMGFRNVGFRYHSSFLFADAREAWVVETAGRFWAAQQVRGVRTLSNVLGIGVPDLVHPGAADEARRRGWLKRGEDFHFARCFADGFYRVMTGGEARRACTASLLREALHRDAGALPAGDSARNGEAPPRGGATKAGRAGEAPLREATGGGDEALREGAAASTRGALAAAAQVMAVLRSHHGHAPGDGWRMQMPCAHASWWPTRAAGQTTGSMVSVLRLGGARHYLTGTSSPCLSVFKPVDTGLDAGALGPAPGEAADTQSLFWRHERLHRAVLQAYDPRRATFEAGREALEAQALGAQTAEGMAEAWRAHRDALPGWLARAQEVPVRGASPVFRWWWRRQARRDGLGV